MYIKATITNNVHRGHHTVIFLNNMLSLGYDPVFFNYADSQIEMTYKIEDDDLEKVCGFTKREPLGGIEVAGAYLVIPDEEKGAKYVGRK